MERKGEKEVPGNRWPEQDWGFQTRGWEGAGHLHLDTARELLPLPSLSREKSWGKGKAAFTQTEGSNTHTPKHPSPTERMDREKAAGGRVREAKVRRAASTTPLISLARSVGDPRHKRETLDESASPPQRAEGLRLSQMLAEIS